MSPVPTPSPSTSRPQLIDPESEPAPSLAPPVPPTPTTPPRAPQRQMYGTATPPLTPPPAQYQRPAGPSPASSTPAPSTPAPGSPGSTAGYAGSTSTFGGTNPTAATIPTGPATVGSVNTTGTVTTGRTGRGAGRKGRSPVLIAAGAFALGGLVGAAGFGLGMQYSDGGTDTANPVVNVSAPVADQAIPTTITPTPSIDFAGSEPAADVARIIGPSVVQVETNFGQGSGVVYADGLILTNHHVIDGASQVRIRTSDGVVFETEVLGSDARNDIAVLSAPGSDLPIAAIGSSAALEPGQLTVAIGSPFQLQQTVTAGIVSSVNRPVPNAAGRYSAMIQTDAPINPGNSGGALANRNGELVGINASIRTDGTSNSNVGIGFAVPIDTAIRVAERIVSGESLEPGLLGVQNTTLDDGIGVPIDEITPGSGAEAAGLQPGDRVVTIEGAPVTSIIELSGLVQSYFEGDTVRLEVLRGETPVTIEAVLG